MKALSLKQPYAELVVSGKKTIEIRKWNTHFRGEFYVHASLKPYTYTMKEQGYSDLPTGVIVGKAILVDVIKYENIAEFNKDQDKHSASTDFGKYGFVLENAERIDPIPAKGKLNFWEYEP